MDTAATIAIGKKVVKVAKKVIKYIREDNEASFGLDEKVSVALFCLVDGKWVGGKWEHLSTDRTTRVFTNIAEGYGGWDKGAVGKADKFAFVICSRDGKRRTNVVLCAK